MLETPASSGPSSDSSAATSSPGFSLSYRRYVLGLLTVVYIVNFVDRQVLSILLESIKLDLGLSDTQLGLLSGTAFGLFYATLGIPIARLADIFSRKLVIVVSLALWSAMTALCGSASGFAMLLLYRVGVGVGEAGGSPPSHAVISDLFAPENRGAALGIFSLGVPVGILVGLLAGGWLDESLGWRTAFVVVGLPGLVLSVIVGRTLREPPRGMADGLVGATASHSAREVIAFLARSRSEHFLISPGELVHALLRLSALLLDGGDGPPAAPLQRGHARSLRGVAAHHARRPRPCETAPTAAAAASLVAIRQRWHVRVRRLLLGDCAQSTCHYLHGAT